MLQKVYFYNINNLTFFTFKFFVIIFAIRHLSKFFELTTFFFKINLEYNKAMKNTFLFISTKLCIQFLLSDDAVVDRSVI